MRPASGPARTTRARAGIFTLVGVIGYGVQTAVLWLLVMAESFLATFARSLFRMSFWWFGPTELRILIIIGALKLLRGGMVEPFGFGPYRLFDIGGVCASAGLVVIFVVNAVRNAAALYREETRW